MLVNRSCFKNGSPALHFLSIIPFLVVCCTAQAQHAGGSTNKLYEFDKNATTRWSSPENLNGVKGVGGQENDAAKGHAFDGIESGASRWLLNVSGAGIINRIWITVSDRSPEMLRGLKLEMFWDGEQKPAVSAPLGDFFGVGLGKTAIFHNSFFFFFFVRSFSSIIPMPFKTGAKIKFTN